jgi:hypothetical protein
VYHVRGALGSATRVAWPCSQCRVCKCPGQQAALAGSPQLLPSVLTGVMRP